MKERRSLICGALLLGLMVFVSIPQGSIAAKPHHPRAKAQIHCKAHRRIHRKVVRRKGHRTVKLVCVRKPMPKKATAPGAPTTPSPSGPATTPEQPGESPVPTITASATVVPVAPQKRIIGYGFWGGRIYGFEIGALHIKAVVTPGGGTVTLSCKGQPAGCNQPKGVSVLDGGEITVPLYAQPFPSLGPPPNVFRVGIKSEEAPPDTGHPGGPTEVGGVLWEFPTEPVGAQFIHLTAEPDASHSLPLSTNVPLDLNGGHYPFFGQFEGRPEGVGFDLAEGEAPRRLLTVGNYEKFDGPESALLLDAQVEAVAGKYEGCLYELAVDGDRSGVPTALPASVSQPLLFMTGRYEGLASGPHSIEVWARREPGSGTGNCAILDGRFEGFEEAP
jgi:hypothetical protein